MPQYLEFVINHWDLFAALLIILLMMFGGPLFGRLRGYKTLEPMEAVQTINHEGAVVLDVREMREIADGMIIDAIHIPLGALGKRIGELDKFKGQPVVVGCRSGHRSGMACAQLKKHGFENVYNLKGGMLAWHNAGLPLTRETRKGKKKK